MGNTITNSKVDETRIGMSNGLTSVFIDAICLAGANMAHEPYQKDIMIWFGQRDWFILGSGVEGFDILEIIWNKEKFYDQKMFILKIIDLAIKKTNLDILKYNPPEAVFTLLTDFKQMINNFRIEHVETEKKVPIFEFDGLVKRYEKCDKHGIYKHFQGCVICNNGYSG